MMSSFGIPDDVVMKFTDKVVLESPNSHYTQHHPGAVLEFADFKRFLVEDAREKGAEFVFDAQVSEPLVEDGQVTGVRYAGGDELTAHLTVDATGPGSRPLYGLTDQGKTKTRTHSGLLFNPQRIKPFGRDTPGAIIQITYPATTVVRSMAPLWAVSRRVAGSGTGR